MNGGLAERVSVDLSPEEARLVVMALRQFEPSWPSDLDAWTRSELLAGIRDMVDHISAVLSL